LYQLSPEAKEVMVLFYLKQLKLTEICEKLHMGMSKVKVIMFRSRAKLKEIY
jgi:DNA-directed RNA polymerase specialized sigma24 family protein